MSLWWKEEFTGIKVNMQKKWVIVWWIVFSDTCKLWTKCNFLLQLIFALHLPLFLWLSVVSSNCNCLSTTTVQMVSCTLAAAIALFITYYMFLGISSWFWITSLHSKSKYRILEGYGTDIEVVTTLLSTFKKSLEDGKLPTPWKDALVTALYKRYKFLPTNYRRYFHFEENSQSHEL